MTVYIFASLIPKPEHASDLEAELLKMVATTRTEPGNLRYDLMRQLDGKPGFHLFESYVDEAAVQAHNDSAHFNQFAAKIGGWLAAPLDIRLLTGIDVAG